MSSELSLDLNILKLLSYYPCNTHFHWASYWRQFHLFEWTTEIHSEKIGQDFFGGPNNKMAKDQ